MRTMWKYQLALANGVQRVEMPKYAAVRKYDIQAGFPCLWAEVDTTVEQREIRQFLIVGTDHPVPERAVYIGTTQQLLTGVSFVWHLYEVTANRD